MRHSHTRVALEDRAAELSDRQSQLGLLSQPVKTAALFSMAVSDFMFTTVASLLSSTPMLLLGYPVLLTWIGTRNLLPHMYTPPACEVSSGPAGSLYFAQLYL